MEKSPSIAFVLIMCNSESMTDVVKQLNEIEIIKETVLVDGPWKIIVKFESTSLDHIRDAIRWKLRKMTGIQSTLTLVEYMN